VLQEVWRDRVWAARPVRVVRDREGLVALWFPRRTWWKAPTTPPEREPERTRRERLANAAQHRDWVFRDAKWDVDTLMLVREGDWHGIWVSWLPTGEPWGWYVNLQEPVRRTPIGFSTMDLMLDVIVELDRSWRWKDEDELALFVGRGLLDEAVAERVRAEGLEVARRAEADEPPFSQPWHEWRPPPTWTLPELRPDWDELQPPAEP
jgi:Protein of unknown function (DUF402)